MLDAYIIHAKRTPIGSFGGSLSSIRVDDLLGTLFADYLKDIKWNPKEIDDILVGNANQAGEDNRNIARMSSILAKYPLEVPATTINRLCGSSLDAIILAAAKIKAQMSDCIVVGGAESMSRAPLVISKAEAPFARNQKIWDTSIGWRFPNPQMEKFFPLLSMGETAEKVAQQFNISREAQDEFALNSHQKAVAAINGAQFSAEILPIEVTKRKEKFTFSTDEGPRSDTSIAKLQKLRAAFQKNGSVTAGNSSSINDGAAMVVVVSETFLKRHNITPLARISGEAVMGCHPNTMGLGPIHATKKLCQKYQKSINDFDVVELNEAFAAQSLACISELSLDQSRVNLRGGAIALGHPLGCSGARILTTLLHILLSNPQSKEGLATMCIGVGQGIALSIEKCATPS